MDCTRVQIISLFLISVFYIITFSVNNINFVGNLFLFKFPTSLLFFFQTGSCRVVQTSLEDTWWPRLASDLQQSSCISLPRAEIKGKRRHAQFLFYLNFPFPQ